MTTPNRILTQERADIIEGMLQQLAQVDIEDEESSDDFYHSISDVLSDWIEEHRDNNNL